MGATKPTLCQLRKLVAQVNRDSPHLTSRLEKAAFLMLLRPIVYLEDHHFRIGSEDGLRFYEVIEGHWECSDYLRHSAGHPCKHRLALAMHQRLESPGRQSPLPGDPGLPRDPLENV